jgi:hypothetical protein
MRGKWIFAAVAAAVFILATNGFAGDKINMKPGKWEITTSVQMPAMPAGMPAGMQMPAMTHTQCITGDELVPDDPNATQQNSGCETQDIQIKGDTVTWKVVCNGEDGKITSSGRITYKGTTFEGEFKTKMPGEGGDITSRMKGRWVGPCD